MSGSEINFSGLGLNAWLASHGYTFSADANSFDFFIDILGNMYVSFLDTASPSPQGHIMHCPATGSSAGSWFLVYSGDASINIASGIYFLPRIAFGGYAKSNPYWLDVPGNAINVLYGPYQYSTLVFPSTGVDISQYNTLPSPLYTHGSNEFWASYETVSSTTGLPNTTLCRYHWGIDGNGQFIQPGVATEFEIEGIVTDGNIWPLQGENGPLIIDKYDTTKMGIFTGFDGDTPIITPVAHNFVWSGDSYQNIVKVREDYDQPNASIIVESEPYYGYHTPEKPLYTLNGKPESIRVSNGSNVLINVWGFTPTLAEYNGGVDTWYYNAGSGYQEISVGSEGASITLPDNTTTPIIVAAQLSNGGFYTSPADYPPLFATTSGAWAPWKISVSPNQVSVDSSILPVTLHVKITRDAGYTDPIDFTWVPNWSNAFAGTTNGVPFTPMTIHSTVTNVPDEFDLVITSIVSSYISVSLTVDSYNDNYDATSNPVTFNQFTPK